MLTLIAAMDRQGVIGDGPRLPWHLPEDLQHFKAVTMGGVVIMGRRTWDSLPAAVRPLPGRHNVVVTRQAAAPTMQPPATAKGGTVEFVTDLATTLQRLQNHPQVFVIGGAQIYAAALPWVQRLLLTEIDAEVPGDVHFPAWDRQAFTLVRHEAHQSAHPPHWRYALATYERAHPLTPL